METVKTEESDLQKAKGRSTLAATRSTPADLQNKGSVGRCLRCLRQLVRHFSTAVRTIWISLPANLQPLGSAEII